MQIEGFCDIILVLIDFFAEFGKCEQKEAKER